MRDRESGGGTEREKERESHVGSLLSAQTPMQDSIPRHWDHDLSRNQELGTYWQSHPGVPSYSTCSLTLCPHFFTHHSFLTSHNVLTHTGPLQSPMIRSSITLRFPNLIFNSQTSPHILFNGQENVVDIIVHAFLPETVSYHPSMMQLHPSLSSVSLNTRPQFHLHASDFANASLNTDLLRVQLAVPSAFNSLLLLLPMFNCQIY